MFRPTQALGKKFRKLRLTTKDINKGFYKGNRTGTVGSHDKHGGFKVDFSKVRTYAVPAGLDTFKLTPFVTANDVAVFSSGSGLWVLSLGSVAVLKRIREVVDGYAHYTSKVDSRSSIRE
ncbi:hypothetical protein diail_5513 [Diaporthe ilicicola]|nr:hypothetical protein diail_5513 [Diaporthe ilicicola]